MQNHFMKNTADYFAIVYVDIKTVTKKQKLNIYKNLPILLDVDLIGSAFLLPKVNRYSILNKNERRN